MATNNTEIGNKLVKAVLEGNEKVLESNKGSINALDEEGYSPLYTACMRHAKPSLVQCILRLGAAVDLKGQDRETPLYIAAFNNELDLVKILIAAGANVNEENGKENETALHAAAKYGYVDVLQLLLQHGANINARTSRMETPLFAAAKNGKHLSVYFLMMNNANANLGNEDGKNPLYIASEKGHKHCVIVLKADPKHLKEAKAEADLELKMKPAPIPTSDVIQQRATSAKAQRDQQEAAAAAAVPAAVPGKAAPTKVAPAKGAPSKGSAAAKAPPPKSSAAPPQLLQERIEIIPLEIPKDIIRERDPVTGEKYGPCRTLVDVGYDEAPVIPKGINLGPTTVPKVGGTSMKVMLESGNVVAPKLLESAEEDPFDYGMILPKAKPTRGIA
jgi:ankyrin repeat protein